ncbi:MAG TPA: LysR family transcriptional regulator [Ktedonobacterales bacterium]|nr:LysR family transcriptional regulator [Ktedonobacterales bacterium]
MELRQLATFSTLARTLNFTRAAALLNYAQSSVTAQIQALEEELGTPLFNRLGRRVTLTDAGQRFLSYAERVLALVDEGRSAVSSTEEMAGTLTIGAPETLCTYRLPALLHNYRVRYPAVHLSYRPAPVADLRRRVSEGELDVAFVMEELCASASLTSELLVAEPVVVVSAVEHPLTQLTSVRPSDLRGMDVLLTEGGCSYRRLFERALAEIDVRPATLLEFNSIEAIKQCVISGMGISALPAVAVAAEVAQGRLAELRWVGPALGVNTQMVWHRHRWLSPPLAAFLDLARETVTDARAAS